jgi:hypothetical protein
MPAPFTSLEVTPKPAIHRSQPSRATFLVRHARPVLSWQLPSPAVVLKVSRLTDLPIVHRLLARHESWQLQLVSGRAGGRQLDENSFGPNARLMFELVLYYRPGPGQYSIV